MTIRLGLLAAARIATKAVIQPVGEVEGVEITAVAARSLRRARATADTCGAQTAYGSYDELLADPDVDAIYIGTPASLHRPWAVAALHAGKHVLCEKPLASNAADARLIAQAAADHPELVAMEAFHWRYHPLVRHYQNIIAGGAIGDVVRAEADFNLAEGRIPVDDIRFALELGGGATMDLGCYSIQWVRSVIGGEPVSIEATATTPVDGIDGRLDAELAYRDGVSARVTSSMVEPADGNSARLVVIGSKGRMVVENPIVPHTGSSVSVEVDGETTTVDGTRLPGGFTATYTHQLVAFRNAIVDGTPFPTTIADGVINMQFVDACYEAAGLPPRPPHQ